jgi:pimeloyl-ACP methyl ester carboxylesterase
MKVLKDDAHIALMIDSDTFAEALRMHLGYERIALLGHLYGGFIALEYALRYLKPTLPRVIA